MSSHFAEIDVKRVSDFLQDYMKNNNFDSMVPDECAELLVTVGQELNAPDMRDAQKTGHRQRSMNLLSTTPFFVIARRFEAKAEKRRGDLSIRYAEIATPS